MTKKKVYIISHSHWDREWYMSYEQHHMRLIRLMDDLLDLFESDPEFHSFHLDGQTIILDDYLQVRPEREADVRRAIACGKLKIGPFYILQDDFLISSEANARNTMIGLEESRKWGQPVMLGYFPDTFGNMGQAPQMMVEAGIKTAAFGRGVKPTGFNNAVIDSDKYTSQFSEMWWQSPDDSKIFAILFANWYSNGNEIPVEKEAAVRFWNQKLADAEKFAATPHLLMMNGVDHQPVQKDVTEAIRLANELFPDYEFIHSSFDDYIEAVTADLPENLNTVSGELTSQETDGWYTLANTASARIYVKQKNTQVQRQLENMTEPLSVMAFQVSGSYPHDELDYAWKTLLQNHPHDSICGCSVDEVHREMMARYEKSLQVGKFLADEALQTLRKSIDTSAFPENSKPFIVFNTSGHQRDAVLETTIEWQRRPFSEGSPSRLFAELEKELPDLTAVTVLDSEGNELPCELVDKQVRFNYDLPDDRFRIPYMAIYLTIRVSVDDLPGMSWKALAAVPRTPAQKQADRTIVDEFSFTLENNYLSAAVNADGLVTVTDKLSNRTYTDLMMFENTGDVGNEYIYKQPEGGKALYAHHFPTERKVTVNSALTGEILVTQRMMIPSAADERLLKEQESVVEMRSRTARRNDELVPFTIRTAIRLDKNSRQLTFTTTVDNQSKDHRLRVLFPTDLAAETHLAESIFEVVERPNDVNENHWKNPENPQHQHSFVNIHDADGKGVTVANYGLNEYELLKNRKTVAVTLLRSVGELGDWGYFPTPEAQCLGEHTVQFAFSCHGKNDLYDTFIAAQQFQTPLVVTQTDRHTGTLPAARQTLAVDNTRYALTALKLNKANNDIVTRGFNLSNAEPAAVRISMPGYQAHEANMIEAFKDEPLKDTLAPGKIHTLRWTKK